MGRSQESWNKKEKEKIRQKKREEKAKKKEERKANPKESGDNFTYVDIYGNFSSTPPDPSKQLKANAEEIEISVPRRAADEAPDPVRKGKVTMFNASKGYGFIRDEETAESVFVHVNGLEEAIQENDKVTFEVEQTHKGLNAVKVKLLKA